LSVLRYHGIPLEVLGKGQKPPLWCPRSEPDVA
jgi:hypothetical protein